jgi:hypothetical protein
MRSKLAHLLVLSAWLLATGVQWDVVQLAAWARMFSNYARVLPVRDAWELTFATENMCGACHAVQDAKQDESGQQQTTMTNVAKEPLVFQQASGVVVTAPSAQPWLVVEPHLSARDRARPVTPPPRATVG